MGDLNNLCNSLDFISMCPGESWESALKRAGLNNTKDDNAGSCE